MSDLWQGLSDTARAALTQRDYSARNLPERLATSGVEVGDLIGADRAQLAGAWIPGVEFLARKVYPQRHRGFFGEFARQEEGLLAQIGFWPRQWASATMFAGTAKGFHIHPPHIPAGEQPADWFSRLFISDAQNYALRPTARDRRDATRSSARRR